MGMFGYKTIKTWAGMNGTFLILLCFTVSCAKTGKEMSGIANSPWNWSGRREPPCSTCQGVASGLAVTFNGFCDTSGESRPLPALLEESVMPRSCREGTAVIPSPGNGNILPKRINNSKSEVEKFPDNPTLVLSCAVQSQDFGSLKVWMVNTDEW